MLDIETEYTTLKDFSKRSYKIPQQISSCAKILCDFELFFDSELSCLFLEKNYYFETYWDLLKNSLLDVLKTLVQVYMTISWFLNFILRKVTCSNKKVYFRTDLSCEVIEWHNMSFLFDGPWFVWRNSTLSSTVGIGKLIVLF